jgi:hypothetical protein
LTTANDEEEWRAVVGFDGYEVSNLGRVRSWLPSGRYKCEEPPPRILAGSINAHGYRAVTMRVDGLVRTLRVHRLVALAFHGEPEPGFDICCHNDGVRTNNHVDNLRWDSHAGNFSDKPKHGTTVRGVDSPTSVLTEAQVLAIDTELRKGTRSQSDIAAEFGVSQGNVGHIATGSTWGWLTGRENRSRRGTGRGGYRARPRQPARG